MCCARAVCRDGRRGASEMLSALLVVWLLCACTSGAAAFPDGAPVDACVKQRANQPHHGQHRPQPPATSPYSVAASSAQFQPNDRITVMISGAEPFKGFFIQARSVATSEWLGEWEEAPNTTRHPECSAVTHADPRDKLRATLVWRAPPQHGRVYFTGTVLKNYSTFWSDIIAQAPHDPDQYLG